MNLKNHVSYIDQKKFYEYRKIFDLLEGWFELGAVRIFEVIDSIQKKNNISGNLFEIGAYSGKSAIILGLMAEFNKESVGVCDIFNNQHNNDSKSGCVGCSKQDFLKNFDRIFNNHDFLNIYEKLSSNLTSKEIGPGYRFFHIDGGHSVEETYKDLCLAERSICRRGIIVIDDFFSPLWPGVSGGVWKFLLKKPNHLAPLLIGHNKFVFCKASEYNWYYKQIMSQRWRNYLTGLDFYTNSAGFLGYNILVVTKEEPEIYRRLTIIEHFYRLSRKLKLKSRRYRKFIRFIKGL